MAEKKYLDFAGLQRYDEKIKEKIGTDITAGIQALDKDDTAVSGSFVTAVSETDGLISVSRAALTVDDIPSLTMSKITDAGTAALKDVATVAIGSEGEVTDALVTSAQVKTYADSVGSAVEGKVTLLEATHAKKTVGEGEEAHEIFKTVAEEAAEEVAKVVADAPEAFDTLKEIAQWIEKEGEEGFDAANRIIALETKTAGLVVEEGQDDTVANAITKAVADEATRINGVVGTPDTGKTIQGEIDDLETTVGIPTVKDEEGHVTTEGTGLTKRIEDLEEAIPTDTFVAITENEIDALFIEENQEQVTE